MKLALGTVQFGLNYGISNQDGQVPSEQVKEILALAHESGIDTLDSAAAYGTSEQCIGDIELSQPFNIVTKIPTIDQNVTDIRPYVDNSLRLLKRDTLEGLLFHDIDSILAHPNKKELCRQLVELKSQRRVKRVGISVYQPKQISNALDEFEFDLVQAPVNTFDQRFIQPDIIQMLTRHKLKLHTRSAFLQGLLLMPQGSWPSYFAPYSTLLDRFSIMAKQLQVSNLTLALAFMVHNSLNESNADNAEVLEKIVVGCCSSIQLAEIIESYQAAIAIKLPSDIWQQFASNEQALINPAQWSV